MCIASSEFDDAGECVQLQQHCRIIESIYAKSILFWKHIMLQPKTNEFITEFEILRIIDVAKMLCKNK